jgi:hypothetical protein
VLRGIALMVHGSICMSTENLWSYTNGEKPHQIFAEQIATTLRFLQLLQQGLAHNSKQLLTRKVERNVLHLIPCEVTSSNVAQCCIKKGNSVCVANTHIIRNTDIILCIYCSMTTVQ